MSHVKLKHLNRKGGMGWGQKGEIERGGMERSEGLAKGTAGGGKKG